MNGMTVSYAIDLSFEEWCQTLGYVSAAERQFPGLSEQIKSQAPTLPPTAHDLSGPDYLSALRRYRAGASIHALWQEMTGQLSTEQMGQTLSGIAKSCLSHALADAEREVSTTHGQLRDSNGEPLTLSIIGMGKLGGHELNFNSDIDVVLTYRAPGTADGRRHLDAGQYLSQVGRGLIARLDTMTEHGRVWAVDTRLRPFGASGALVWSLPAIEAYFLSEGRTWERYAWLKASHSAGDKATSDAVLDTLRPFIYRRYRDYGIFESLRALHAKIDGQANASSDGQDIKRGRGGIRALEFLVQSLQLLEGGRTPSLQTPDFLGAVRALAASQFIDAELAQGMTHAYEFLRTLENRLQALTARQTHRLPTQPAQVERLAQLMGFGSVCEFERFRTEQQAWVHAQFSDLFLDRSGLGELSNKQQSIEWPPIDSLHASLVEREVDTSSAEVIADALTGLHQRLSKKPLSAEGRARLERLMPLFIETLTRQRDPTAGLNDLIALIETIARRSAYLALMYERPEILDHVIQVFGTSEKVAQWIIQAPQLLDDLIDPAHYATLPSPPVIDSPDPEQALNSLARWRQTRFLKTALAELSQSIDAQTAGKALSDVAQTCIQNILESIEQSPPLAVIAYGNLGAKSLHYASDLDCVFLHAQGEVESEVVRIAQRLITLMQLPLPGGRLFEIDTRLRPNGRAGLLVSHIDRFSSYQEDQAWLWEHQALIRARWIAGDQDLACRFETIRQEVLAQARDPKETAQTLWNMRQKQTSGRSESPIKKRLTDIQFVGEWAVLTQAHQNVALLDARATQDQLELAEGLPPSVSLGLQASFSELTNALHHQWLSRDPEPLKDEMINPIDALIAEAWQTIQS